MLAAGITAFIFTTAPAAFFPLAIGCRCGADTRVLKTRRKIPATLAIGRFEALETQRHCPRRGEIHRSEELRAPSPHGGRFGFDVIEHIGRALFVHRRSERAVQAGSAAANIPVPISEIGFPGKRFIVYPALAHRACRGALREHMTAKGGCIPHPDATCEGDSPPLFSRLDEIDRIVPGNRKMPTEDSGHIIPLLRELKAAYGTPPAAVHDRGRAILKAVAAVFPAVPDHIRHFHFLREIPVRACLISSTERSAAVPGTSKPGRR